MKESETTTALVREVEEEVDEEEKEVLHLVRLARPNLGHALELTNITKLDLPNCNLSSLPLALPDCLPNLSILFLSNNNFRQVPAVIGACWNLQMVAFKSNHLSSIHPDALQSQMRWLILTDNQITSLPSTIGRCRRLQKLMLSGNALTALPPEISNCHNLELIRLASNCIQEPPLQLLKLPNLRWVALANNPFLEGCHSQQELASLPTLTLDDDDDKSSTILGQGAGGVTTRTTFQGKPVAVKTFCGAITSDGLPEQERTISLIASSLQCSSLISILGETNTGALVMEFIDHCRALAGPPSLTTCSRDVYPPNVQWTPRQALNMVSSLLEALTKLHNRGICHGDFYAHNILVQTGTDPSSLIKLSDFGAAFLYDRDSEYGPLVEKTELRAFSVLVEEIVRCLLSETRDETVIEELGTLATFCLEQATSFDEVSKMWQNRTLAELRKV